MQFESTASVLPVARRVTSLALLTELAKMLIGMAVNTAYAYMIEDRILVASDTLSGRMRSYQLEAGRSVVEGQRITHLRPGVGGVAILTVPLQLPVGISYCRLAEDHSADQQQQRGWYDEETFHERLLLSGLAVP